MTPDKQLKAGRELDALIAERVMGYPRPPDSEAPGAHKSRTTHKNGQWYWSLDERDPGWIPVPYSTEIGMAWRVAEKLREIIPAQNQSQTYTFSLSRIGITGKWACVFGLNDPDWRSQAFVDDAESAPLAICLAALLAMKKVG